MTNKPDWRQFEELIARIEADAAPFGFVVTSPDKITSLITGDLREVDASIRFSTEGTEKLVTIECRKRGAREDVTWIEQLATKKLAIGAVRTIAVSSSGFSTQAKKAAAHYGIELCTASEITVSDSNPFLRLDFALFPHKVCSIAQVAIRRYRDAEWTLPSSGCIDFQLPNSTDPFLDIFLNTQTNEKFSLNQLWHQAQELVDPFANVGKGMPPVIRTACFPFPGNVVIDTGVSTERLGDVLLSVALAIEIEQVALDDAKKMSYRGTGGTDLQRLEFRSVECTRGEWSIAIQLPRTASDVHEMRTRLVSPDDKMSP